VQDSETVGPSTPEDRRSIRSLGAGERDGRGGRGGRGGREDDAAGAMVGD
jgi:hypothetical protein